MAYDPSQDPRHIPVDNLAEREEAERETELGAVEQSLYDVDQILALFERPGWDVIVRRLSRERDSLQGAADRSHVIGEWHFLRGQIVALDAVLSLPSRTDSARRSLLQQARDLAPQSGEEDQS